MKALTTTVLLAFLFHFGYSQDCLPPAASAALDVNNVSALVNVGGDLWWDYSTARYELPRGSGKNPLFSGALWMGGYDGDQNLSTAAILYRQSGNDFWPGPLDGDGNTMQDVCLEFDRVWKINRSEIENFLAGGSATEAMINWPAKGNVAFDAEITHDLAPFFDANNDGIYESADGDYPLIKGDQAIFYVFNDRGNVHTESGGDYFGFEFHVMAYAYATNDAVNDATYYDYTIINKSGETFHDVFIGQFTDVDLGNSSDDYVGVDTTRNLAFSYNGDDFDDGPSGYGTDLPMIGIQTHHSPNGETMHNFTHLVNGNGDPYKVPSNASEYYNMLSGKTAVGGARTNANGDSVLHTFPGTPDGSGESMCSASILPSDYKMMQSYGPMEVEDQDILHFSYSVVFSDDESIGQGNDCPDPSAFFGAADVVDDLFQDDKCILFDPEVTATISPSLGGDAGQIKIKSLGTNGTFSYAWSNGATGSTVSNLSVGSYSVTVTNGYGCSVSESFEVTESPIGIEESQEASVSIFPNPTSGTVHIQPAPSSGSQIEVFDLTGKLVIRSSYNGAIDLSTLDAGLYSLRSERGVFRVQVTGGK